MCYNPVFSNYIFIESQQKHNNWTIIAFTVSSVKWCSYFSFSHASVVKAIDSQLNDLNSSCNETNILKLEKVALDALSSAVRLRRDGVTLTFDLST